MHKMYVPAYFSDSELFRAFNDNKQPTMAHMP